MRLVPLAPPAPRAPFKTFPLVPNLAKLGEMHGGARPPVLKCAPVKWGLLGALVVMIMLNS